MDYFKPEDYQSSEHLCGSTDRNEPEEDGSGWIMKRFSQLCICVSVICTVCLVYSWVSGNKLVAPPIAAVASQVSAASPKAGFFDATTIPIQDIVVGHRVLCFNPQIDEEERTGWTEPAWERWVKLSLVMPKQDGTELTIEMLRPESWVLDHKAAAGSVVNLNLVEMGAEGSAKILAISPAPKVKTGTGKVITATFKHKALDKILNIRFEGDTDPIGVTDNHPFWSVRDKVFKKIGDFEIGETIRTIRGETKRVVSKLPRPCPSYVYNLEVHDEHVYYVGEQVVLVHNEYDPTNGFVFRGTTRGYTGRIGVSFASTDLAAAVAFAVQKRTLGSAVLEIVRRKDLTKVARLPSTSPTLAKLEAEVIFDISPADFSKLATQVPLSDALKALRGIGVEVPSHIPAVPFLMHYGI